MRPTDHLKSLVAEDWQAATHHAFTDALADGSLSLDKMAGYLQQDYLFVEDFVRLLASAVAHAPTLADAVPAAQFLGVISGPENTYFLRSMDALQVPYAAPRSAETEAFCALMKEARLSGRYEQMLAVLTVAEWLYLEWAAPFEKASGDLPFWFGEWIDLHCGEGFETVVGYLRGQLDAQWVQLDTDARKEVESLFCRAVVCERAFFDAAWMGFEVAR